METLIQLQRGGQVPVAMTGGYIPGTGRYRLLAIQNAKGQFEWTHFTERDNGYRDHFMRGVVQDRVELGQLVSLINQTLQTVFGENAVMKETALPPLSFPGIRQGERLI
jgi:hypothetical protein